MIIKIKRIRINFQIRYGYNSALTEYIKTIPKDQIRTQMESLVVNGKTYEDWYKACNISGLSKVLWYCWDNKIQFHYENVKESDIVRIEEFAKTKRLRYKNALRLKSEGYSIDNVDYSFMKIQPHPYQKEAVQFFEEVGGVALLGDSPGVGKSLAAIAYATKNKLKTLLICPASLKLNWRKEILKFTHEKAYIFKYKPKKKENTINYSPGESLFHIINYESLDTYLKFDVHHKCQNQFCNWEATSQIKKIKTCPNCFKEKSVKSRNTQICKLSDKDGMELNIQDYDLVVLDEAHFIKENSINRTKIVKTAFKSVRKKLLLTGTAIKNRPYEFFSLLNFLDEFEWVNVHNFGIKYCDGQVDDYDHWHYDGHSNLEELYERISYLFLRRLKKDVLKHLPPKTYTIIPIDLSPEQFRDYKKLEKGIVDETNESDPNMSHLGRIQKLKQFTSMVNAENAIEFIQNYIDGDEKIVVFTQFLSTADFIYEKFKECAVLFNGQKNMQEKNFAVETFMNDEKCKVFVGTIGAAGVGITLTSASICLFIDRPWEPGSEEQCEDRIHRANQTASNIQIIKMICQQTIDEDIDKLLAAKKEIVSKVLDGEYIENKKEFSIFYDLLKILISKKTT